MTVLEAMASGLPVVASDLPAIREAAEGNAIFVDPKDVSKWIEAVGSLLKDLPRQTALSEKGKRISEKHLWENKAKTYEAFLIKAHQNFSSKN